MIITRITNILMTEKLLDQISNKVYQNFPK